MRFSQLMENALKNIDRLFTNYENRQMFYDCIEVPPM